MPGGHTILIELTRLSTLGCVVVNGGPLLEDDTPARIHLIEQLLGSPDCCSACSFAVLLNLQQECACYDVLGSAGIQGRHAKVASSLHLLTACSRLGWVQQLRNNLGHFSVRACQCVVSTRSLQAVFIEFNRLACNAEVNCVLTSHTVR